MISLVAILLIIGVFIAGNMFLTAGWVAWLVLGVCVAGLGTLIAAAETRGFQGQYCPLPTGVTWGSASKQLYLMNENKARFFNDDKLYVQTPTGPVAISGIFQARINHEMSIVFDVSEPADPNHEFNRLKQGVI